MNLIDFLNSINQTKQNLIRNSDSTQQAEKMYPSFPVARSLSYHEDCILLVNELNIRGTSSHGVSNIQHYEFLLYLLNKKKRFAKWEKPEKSDIVDLIKESFNYSTEKAESILPLLSDKDIKTLQDAANTGGKYKG